MRRNVIGALALVAWCAGGGAAEAYIGPGAGISVVGTAVAVVGAVVFAIVGFVWYPIKRLVAAIKRSTRARAGDENAALPKTS
jgi:hypothetical protein